MHDVIDAIGNLQRRRRFWIKAEVKLVNSFQALIRLSLGAKREDEKANARARQIAAAALAGKPLPDEVAFLEADALSFREMMLPIEKARGALERDMKRAVRKLPGAEFAASVKGFGELGFAVIVGEAGDLSGYPSKGHLWQRLGLGLHNGQSGGTWRREGGLSNDDWTAFGYSAQRRAEVFATVQDSLFRWQTHSGGPYRAVYDRRRARAAEAHPDWRPARLHADAGRVMVKALIKDLWRAWRATTHKIADVGQSCSAEHGQTISAHVRDPIPEVGPPVRLSIAQIAQIASFHVPETRS